jgi:hypothetical protein
MREIISHIDFCSLLVLAVAAYIVARKVEEGYPRVAPAMRWAAGAAFLGVGTWAVIDLMPVRADELFTIAATASLAAASAALATALTMAPVAAVWSWVRSRIAVWRWSRADRRRQREQDAREERERRDRQEEWERQRPEREKWERKAEATRATEAAARKRREDARAKCEIFFGLHAPEIGARFSKAMYDDFVRRHLGDDHTPEHVEERARQLVELLERHLDKIEPADEAPQTIGDLTTWYEQATAEIEARVTNARIRNTSLAQLKEQYAERLQQILGVGQ